MRGQMKPQTQINWWRFADLMKTIAGSTLDWSEAYIEHFPDELASSR